MSDTAAAAAEVLLQSQATAAITTPDGELPDDAPPVIFDRLSVERRALCAISPELYTDRLGARNTLAAITDYLTHDPNTTHPPAPNARLEIDGLTLVEQCQLVEDHLTRLVDAGLAAQDEDGAYHVTEAGVTEMQS